MDPQRIADALRGYRKFVNPGAVDGAYYLVEGVVFKRPRMRSNEWVESWPKLYLDRWLKLGWVEEVEYDGWRPDLRDASHR